MIIGHLAIAALIHDISKDQEPISLVIGSVFPDVGDKTIKYVRQLHEGRSFFHSLFGFALTATGLWFILSRRSWRSWAIGYAAHLAADLGGDLPLFHPFRTYEFSYTGLSYSQKVRRTITHPKWLETVFIFWAIYIFIERWLSGTKR